MAILQFRRGGSLVGSLLASEMFFDETINTFKIGTDGSGAYVIVTKLNESNVGSLSLTGNISASNAYFTGNVDLDGDIFIGGNITLGAGGNDTIFVGAPLSGSLIPLSGSEYNLGSTAKPWNTVYVDNLIATTITGSVIVSYPDITNKPTLVSGSSQIDHNTTSNYVLNEHINHQTLNISAGNGLSGGGNITASRTLTLDTGSTHFTSGVKTKLNTENVLSSSAQLYTEFDLRYLNTAGEGIVSGSSQVSYPLLSNIPANIVSGSTQITPLLPTGTVSGSAQLTSSYDTRYETRGRGIVSGSSQVTPLIPTGTVSGSSQVDLTQTTNYVTGIKTRLNAETVISGSSQVSYVNVSNIPSGIISSSNQLTSVFLETGGDNVVSGSSQVSYPALSNIPSGIVSGSSQLDGTTINNLTASGSFSGSFHSDYVTFNTIPQTTSIEQGTVSWNDGDGTLDLILKGGLTTLQLGQEQHVMTYNDSGVPLVDGDVVYIKGAQGNRISVGLAANTIEGLSSVTIGLVTEPIAMGAEGFVTTFGLVRNLNTLGLTEGLPIYLGATTGSYTQVKPVAPAHTVIVGYVIRAHESVGSIFVKVYNGFELDELHDVLITDKQNDNGLFYETATQVWKNKTVASVLPTGTVSGSSQVSFTTISNKPTLVSGSSQVSYVGLSNIPANIVSGSSQLTSSYDTRYETRGRGIVSGSTQITPLLPTGTISGSSQVTGYEIVASGTHTLVSGSSQITLTDTIGQLSGSRIIGDIQASSVEYASVLNKPTLVSGSSQVSYPLLSNIPAGIVSGSTQIVSLLPTGTVSGSSQVSFTTISNKPTLVSGSSQVIYTQLSSIPAGIVSGAAQVTPLLPTGTLSGSSQVNADTITNFDSNVLTYINSQAVLSGSGYLKNTTDTLTGNLTITGIITAQEFHTEFISSSIIYESGSTKFGDTGDDYHQFTGSVFISGSLGITNNALVTNLNADLLDSQHGAYYLSYTNFTNLPTLISGSNQISYPALSNIPAGIISSSAQVNADTITNFDANVLTYINSQTVVSGSAQIAIGSTTGTLAVNKGGTNQTTYVNGELLIGNTTGNTLAKSTLTQGTGITITNGAGTITIAAVNNGTVTSVAAGNGMSFTTITGTGTVTLGTPSTLTASTTNTTTTTSHTHAITGFYLDTNPSGFTANAGTVTSVTAGNGMTQTGGTSPDPVLNIVSHAGSAGTIGTINIGADAIGVNLGITSTTACAGNDSRLSDARTPTSHVHGNITNAGAIGTTSGLVVITTTSGVLTTLASAASTLFLNGTGAYSTPSYFTTANARSAISLTTTGNSGTSTYSSATGVLNVPTYTLEGLGYSAPTIGDGTITIAAGTGLKTGGIFTTNQTGNSTVTLDVAIDELAEKTGAVVGTDRLVGTTGTTNWAETINTIPLSIFNNDLGNYGGWITGYTETDTLQTVTTRGSTTSTAITFTNATASTTYGTGAVIISGGLGVAGNINAGGEITAYATSDIRLKHNITPITNPIQKVQQLSGNTFDWDENLQDLHKGSDIGVIAQEVELLFPSLVSDRTNGYKGVKYEKIVPLLIEAIKEQQNQIEDLKKEIFKLKRK